MSRRDDAPLDLLFGLLALQNGMITRDQLVAAFGAWTASDHPMADLLLEQGALSPSRRALLDALAAEHLAAHGNDPEKSLAALEMNRSTRESLAAAGGPQVEATLVHVGSGSGSNGDADRTATYSVGTATSDGQRFRVLRPHARGGLGAVFVALDSELHREVALKQILEEHADDPISRQRFLLEAEVTGGLEHPGIVPVYGLGTYGDGRPYYAMRFIKGDSLREAIRHFHADESLGKEPGHRSLELRKLLRRFMDVCNAIEYAHSRGVLHRDVKPGNIVIGKHGETLVVDWGLAKATGKSDPGSGERTLVPCSASGSAETLPGSALGTPAYMSPEQASGDLDHLGTRSDVYSLGATLYSLLTGKPPFENDDIGAMLRAVQNGEFPPPRQLDATIDPALEAICKKAMALKPQERYATCKALSDDVERWMADEPVTAWREPIARRARRWARRNRTAATAASVALLTALVALGAVTAVQARANTNLRAANNEVRRVNVALNAEKARVQERYELAVEAIKTFHTGVSEDFLLKEEKFKALRDRLLKSAADFYGKLGALLDRETDTASRRALAASNFELAKLTTVVGKSEDALAAHRAVLASREALAAEPGADAAIQIEVGRSLTAVGAILRGAGKMNEAEAAYRRSDSLLARPAASDAAARAALAECRSELGRLLNDVGRPAQALATYKLARTDQEALAASGLAQNDAHRALALTVMRVGVVLHEMGKLPEAEAEYRRSLELFRRLAGDHPDVPDFRRSLANVRSNFAVVLEDTGRSAEAEAEHREVLAIRRELVRENPGVNDFRSRLADSHHNLGHLLEKMARRAEAETEYRESLAIRQELVRDNPAVTGFTSRLAGTHHSLAWVLWQTGRLAAAESHYRQALAIDRKLVRNHPAVKSFRSDLATLEDNFAWVLARIGRHAEAANVHRQALALYQMLVQEHDTVSDYRNCQAQSHARLGWLLTQAGEPAAAEAEFRAALAIFQKLTEHAPTVQDYRDRAANVDNNLSVALRRLGRPREARDHVERAIAIREALLQEAHAAQAYRAGLAENLLNCGLARRALGDLAGAADDIRRATVAYDAMTSLTSEAWFLSACAHAALAGLAGQAGSGVLAEERQPEADRAMALLRQAVAAGYCIAKQFRTDDALNPLRDRDDFGLLIADLEFPSDPFAPETDAQR